MKISTLQKFLIIALIIFTGQGATGQTADIKIQYTDSANLTLNGIAIEQDLAYETISKSIGEASRKEEYPSGETGHYYEEQGIVIMTVEGKVKGMAVNYNWTGDEKLPKQTFPGELFLDNLIIATDTKSKDIEGIRNKQFFCPIPKMCATFDKMSKTPCIIFFEDNVLSSVTFLIK